MKIHIKHMFCPAHKFFVRLELDKLGIIYKKIDLGEIDVSNKINKGQIQKLRIALLTYGFELSLSDKIELIQKIKRTINEFVDYPELEANKTLSDYIVQLVNRSYTYLNEIFIEDLGYSIEWYYAKRKIDTAIDLLVTYNLNLTEICYQLNYENEEQFEAQLRMITGLTPQHLKRYLV